MTSTQPAGDYIRRVAGASTDSHGREQLQQAVELYDRKLWHELTQKCLTLSTTLLKSDPELYTSFVIHFQKHLNRVSLVQILTNLVHHAFDPVNNPDAALTFLKTTRNFEDVLEESPDALILYYSLCASLLLHANKAEDAKAQLEEAKTLVDATFDLEANTHAAFYKATAQFHKVMGPASDFYKHALLFLAYTSPNTLTEQEKKMWAFDIAIAALVGEDNYRFEEVLKHGLVQEMAKSEQGWLVELMEVMDRGDVEGYGKLVQKYGKVMDGQEALVRNKEFLEKKNKILGLVALAERKDGAVEFGEVEEWCKVEKGEVEYLIMRALSLGLITGTIDGVEQVLQVEKVRPKLLNRENCREMAGRLEIWRKNVTDINDFMESESGPFVAT